MSLGYGMTRDAWDGGDRAAFVAGMAHNLRTPLMVLLGASDLLLRGADDLTDEQRVLVEALRRNALALTRVVNDALAALEQGAE